MTNTMLVSDPSSEASLVVNGSNVQSESLEKPNDFKSFVGSPVTWFVIVYSVILLAAIAVPLASLALHLTTVTYFQHYPILILAALGWALIQLRRDGVQFAYDITIRAVYWLLLATLLVVGVYVLPSRWMAAPAAFALLVGIITFVGGKKLRDTLVNPLWFALATIPPPSNLANWFMIRLQNLATSIASYWLDFFSIYHNTTGVAIKTPLSDYLVKDACSGIQSVFAAIAVGIFYGTMRHYKTLRLAILLIQLTGWVLVANALRVFFIIYVNEKYQVALLEGLAHDAVGATTFIAGLGLALSCDHLFRFIIPIYVPRTSVEEFEDGHDIEPLAGEYEVIVPPAVPVSIRWFGWFDYVLPHIISLPLLIASLAVGAVFSLTYFKFEIPKMEQVAIKDLVTECCVSFEQIDEEYFPPMLNGWKRMGYEREERGADSVFGGMMSFRWQYMHPNGRRVILSLDGPYDNWHDLTACYAGLGWQMTNVQRRPAVGLTSPLSAYDLEMRRGGIDHAQSIYVCWDKTGRNIVPPENHGTALTTVVSRVGGLFDEPKPIVGGAIQLQLFSMKANDFSISELDENRDLFWTASQWMLQKIPNPNSNEGKD